jgi:DNA ligase-1
MKKPKLCTGNLLLDLVWELERERRQTVGVIDEKRMMLGVNWEGQDPTGWLASEKMDGCRAYWDGSRFWTRSGRVINAPQSITGKLPAIPLDGEIWAGRGGFQRASVAVRLGKFTPEIRFVCFDAPGCPGTWLERWQQVANLGVDCVTPIEIKSKDHLFEEFCAVKEKGGEGLVLRCPVARDYQPGRGETFLKVREMEQIGLYMWSPGKSAISA